MAVSDEFRRLLLHAAERLAEEDQSVRAALRMAVTDASNGYNRGDALTKLTSYVAASTYAQLVMEMTARFLTDGSEETNDAVRRWLDSEYTTALFLLAMAVVAARHPGKAVRDLWSMRRGGGDG